PIYRELYGTSIREDHWEKMNGMNFVWSPEGLDVDELDREYMGLIAKFYRQRRVRKQYAQLSLRYPGHFARLTRCGIGLAIAKTRSLLQGRHGLLTQGNEVN